MNKIVISILIIGLIASHYVIDLQNDHIEQKKLNLIKLEKNLTSINSIEFFKSKINNINIPFDSQEAAREKIIDKIMFYQNSYSAKITKNIYNTNNILNATLTISIDNNNESIQNTLKQLSNDSFINIDQFKITHDQLSITLNLKYPFISEKTNKTNLSQLLKKYYDINNIDLTTINFSDINTKNNIAPTVKPTSVEHKKYENKDIIIDFIFIGNKKVVCIDSKILTIGDNVQDYKITQIKQDKILIENMKEQKWLKTLK